MVRQEGVRMMEREAEAERRRQEHASPQEKIQEQPSGLVSVQISFLRRCYFFCNVHGNQRCVTIIVSREKHCEMTVVSEEKRCVTSLTTVAKR